MLFIGRRETGEEILPALAEAVERHITEHGVTAFTAGGYGSFDHMAASAARTVSSVSHGSTFSSYCLTFPPLWNPPGHGILITDKAP